MDAYVEQIGIAAENNTVNLYKVSYCVFQGNGYDTGSRWADFGVYEDESTANAVARGIENGSIRPLRK